MPRHSFLTFLLFLATAGIIQAQAPERRSDPHFGSVEVHLNQKWFLYPLNWYAVELVAPSGQYPPVRTREIDKEGAARIGLLSPGRHILNIKQSQQGQLAQWAEMSFPIEITAEKSLVLNIPSDLKIDLVPCLYDSYVDPPRFVESKNAMRAYWRLFPYGYPTLTGSSNCPPSRRLMALPRRLEYPKGELAVRVFPGVPYDDPEDSVSLGLLINDTDKDLEFGNPRVSLEAKDRKGQWEPIEGPDYLVIDTYIPPGLLPAHSCRNFPVRHYKGPFKTLLRIVMKGLSRENPTLISEPFEGFIHLSQITHAKKLLLERWGR